MVDVNAVWMIVKVNCGVVCGNVCGEPVLKQE